MKTNRLCNRSIASAAVLLGCAAILTGDIPGGPGRILTPFADPEHVTVEQVAAAKEISAKTRTISGAALASTNEPVSGKQVALAFARGGVLSGEPFFALQGIDPKGQKATADFSEIASMVLASVDRHLLAANEVTLECKLFPTITPAELVRSNPTYSRLEDDYTNTIRIRLAATDSQKRDLCLVRQGDRGYEVMARIADLKVDSPIVFQYGRHRFGQEDRAAIWWAIGSVVRDPRYPHRLTFKK